jgi:tetratricopeptide (TPR) repeat protein
MKLLSINIQSAEPKVMAHIRFSQGADSIEANTEFDFAWSQQDQENLRWYLEDYLIYPADPAPSIAKRVEQRIAAAGSELFCALFRSSNEASGVWQAAAADLSEVRIELSTAQPQSAALPWELIREPDSQTILALSCGSFVRVHTQPSRPAVQPAEAGNWARMLLVMCRPGGAEDVPFRSVARNLLQGLRAQPNQNIQVDVLRPPTFGKLNAVLRESCRQKRPYHIVHFDGHGLPGGLVFENPANPNNMEIVLGQAVGQLLADSKVPVLVLNACRSAFPDPPSEPVIADNIHEEIRAFGSLAHVVADQGVPCVLAMRFNVFVETAARFMLNFYSALASGCAVGEAANAARSQLFAEPFRQSTPSSVRLEDWIVPLAFEAKPLHLLGGTGPQAALPADEMRRAKKAEDDLPRRPDAGFFGRDETLLALDRAFDVERVVLLHAYAGSGKTATATEFARWYYETDGTREPALFTSFDTKRTLDQVVDQLGRRLEPQLAKAGMQWAAIVDSQERRKIALECLSKLELFWIWDNVELIAGFPTGAESAWLPEEQTELADFLRDASERGTKFLLTSRRDESGWLNMLPARITMPAMPFWERVQLAQSLAQKMRLSAFEMQDWRPLLEFTQGNPLALTVLVTQALRKRIRTSVEMEKFLSELQSGAADLRDDPVQGRSRSLTASLNYGLAHAFTEDERKAIALLHLFQGHVNRAVFQSMGTGPQPIPEVEQCDDRKIVKIFETARELGILESPGSQAYRIHPAVPWFFREAFDKYFAGREAECRRQFCLAVGMAGVQISQAFNHSAPWAAAALSLEEANLRYALKLAIQLPEWAAVMATLHALEDLYVGIRGHRAEWRKLVSEISPIVTDESTGRSIPGREIAWRAVCEYRMRLAADDGKYAEAERFARLLVEYFAKRAEPFLVDETKLGEGEEEVQNLVVMLISLAQYLGQRQSSEGVQFYERALNLSVKIGNKREAARAAEGLGWTYRAVDAIRDLDKALSWFLKGLELAPKDDFALSAKLLVMCGGIWMHWLRAALTQRDIPKIKENLGYAMGAYIKAYELLPEYAFKDRAECLGNLASIYLDAGRREEAEKLYRQALPLARKAGAADFETKNLLNIALVLQKQSKFDDAIAFAKAAEKVAAQMGEQGQDLAMEALKLLADIRRAQKAEGQGA